MAHFQEKCGNVAVHTTGDGCIELRDKAVAPAFRASKAGGTPCVVAGAMSVVAEDI